MAIDECGPVSVTLYPRIFFSNGGRCCWSTRRCFLVTMFWRSPLVNNQLCQSTVDSRAHFSCSSWNFHPRNIYVQSNWNIRIECIPNTVSLWNQYVIDKCSVPYWNISKCFKIVSKFRRSVLSVVEFRWKFRWIRLLDCALNCVSIILIFYFHSILHLFPWFSYLSKVFIIRSECVQINYVLYNIMWSNFRRNLIIEITQFG